MPDHLDVPVFDRLTDWLGPWAIEPTRGAALWELVRGTDLPTHMAAASTPTTRSTRRQGGPNNIAVIGMAGTLKKSAGSFGGTSTVQLRRDIRQAATDPDVGAILLMIDSPGGTVAGTDDLAREVAAARQSKPVWAFVEDLGASAAYWIASQADRIFANSPTALVGSIGTIAVIYDYSAAAEKAGIRTLVFSTGPLKGTGVEGAPVTADQAAYFQGLIDSMHVSFEAAVKKGRRFTQAQMDAVRSGAVFSADEALSRKLIDGIQSLDATFDQLAHLASSPKTGVIMATETTLDAATIRSQERERLAAIDKLCTGLSLTSENAQQLDALRGEAIAGDITVEALGSQVLDLVRRSQSMQALRDSRPQPLSVGKGRGGLGASSQDLLTAGLLVKAGFEKLGEQQLGAHAMQASRDAGYHRASLLDLCRASLHLEGKDAPSGNQDLIRAALSGGTGLPTALGTAANKVLAMAYSIAPSFWRSIAAVKSAKDFKVHNSIRGTFGGNLTVRPKGADFDHGVIGEEVTKYRVHTFGKFYAVDFEDIVNDDASMLSDIMPSLGRAAARSLNDLVAWTILTNKDPDGAAFWTGSTNYQSGGGTALQSTSLTAAIKLLRQMRDDENNLLDLEPAALLVPADLEATARELINSRTVARAVAAADRVPEGNVHEGIASIVVEPRLGAGVTLPSADGQTAAGGSTTAWYLFSAPGNGAVVVAFLDGQETPTIEQFGLQADPKTLCFQYRVYHCYGVALGDARAAIKSAGA